MTPTINHYYTENQRDIFEDIQKGFTQDDAGDFLLHQLLDSRKDIESILNECEHSGKYSQAELILFVETVRVEGI